MKRENIKKYSPSYLLKIKMSTKIFEKVYSLESFLDFESDLCDIINQVSLEKEFKIVVEIVEDDENESRDSN